MSIGSNSIANARSINRLCIVRGDNLQNVTSSNTTITNTTGKRGSANTVSNQIGSVLFGSQLQDLNNKKVIGLNFDKGDSVTSIKLHTIADGSSIEQTVDVLEEYEIPNVTIPTLDEEKYDEESLSSTKVNIAPNYGSAEQQPLLNKKVVNVSREGFCKRNRPAIISGVVGTAVGAFVTWLLMRGGHNVSNNAVSNNSSALTVAADLITNLRNSSTNPAQIMQGNGYDLNDNKVKVVLDNYNLTRIYINDIEEMETIDTDQIANNLEDFVYSSGNETACFNITGKVSTYACNIFAGIAALAKGQQ